MRTLQDVAIFGDHYTGDWSDPVTGDVVKVIVVDDEALVRSGVSLILNASKRVRVVATCDGVDAVAMVQKHRPHVALVDIRMPVVDGLSVLRQLRSQPMPPVVAMLTTFSADAQVAAALREGASGFLLKDSEPEDLVAAVLALAAGGSVLSPKVTGAVVAGFVAARASSQVLTAISSLSDREREVLALVGEGLSNVAIAERLFLSVPTVKEHVSAILFKLGAENRVQAAVMSFQAGLHS